MRRGEQQKLLRGYGRPTRPGSGSTTIPLSPSPLRISHHDITSRQSAVNIQIPEFSGYTRQYEPTNIKDLQKCTPNFGKPYINPMQPGRWATSKVRPRPAASRSQCGGFVKFAESMSLDLALLQATQLLVELQCQARNACITKTRVARLGIPSCSSCTKPCGYSAGQTGHGGLAYCQGSVLVLVEAVPVHGIHPCNHLMRSCRREAYAN